MPILSGFAPRGGQWRRRQRRAPAGPHRSV